MLDPKIVGLQLFHQGRFSDALPLLEQALQFVPNDGYLHLCAGIAYASQHQQAQAELHLSKAIWLRPNDALAQYNWACLMHQQGRHAEALAAYDTAVRLDPSLIAARTAADSLRRSMGQAPASSYGHPIQAQPYGIGSPYYMRRNNGRIFNWLGLLCAVVGYHWMCLLCVGVGCRVCPALFGVAAIIFAIIGAIRGDVGFGIFVVVCGTLSIVIGTLIGWVIDDSLSTMPGLQ